MVSGEWCCRRICSLLSIYGYALTTIIYLHLLHISPVESHKCDVLVFFSLKTARCDELHLPAIPRDLGRDIKVLSFAQNSLTYLAIDQFKIYPSLQEIYIVKNKIDTIAPDAFRGLRNLQILDLEGNKLTSVPSAAFKHLKSVRILIMKDNPISYITENAFGNLPNIEELNFENCWLSRLDPKAFHGLPKLTEINLVNNELTSFSAEMEASLPQSLKVFRIYRNPWKCDCRLRWLRQWIANTKVNWHFAQNTPACSDPAIIRGINWKHLNPEKFACPTRILANSTTTIEFQPKQNITIECIIFGDPQPKITWFKGNKGIHVDYQKYVLKTGEDDVLYQIKSILTVWDATSSDQGDYKCVAANSAGRAEVTYKLWMSGLIPEPNAGYTLGISQESILGIAVGGAVFILILVICVVYGLRRRDRRRHAYKVRDYKKQNNRGNKNDKKVTENNEKCIPNATTELLSEKKEKEAKEKEKEKEKENKIKKQNIANNIYSKNKSNDFQMKVFASNNGEATETDPLCKDTNKPVCDDMREVTPDLLKNDHKGLLHNSKQTSKEENPYVVMNSTTPKVGNNVGNHVGPPPPKGEKVQPCTKPEPPKRNTSLPENQKKSEDKKQTYKDSSTGEQEKAPERHRGSREDLLRQSSSGSKDSLSSPPQSSTRSSPARTPTSSKDSLVKGCSNPSKQGQAARVINSQSMTGSMNKMSSQKHGGSKDNLSDKYSTLPTKVRRPDSSNPYGTVRPPTGKQSHRGPPCPVAVAGVVSPNYPTLNPAKNSPNKAQVQQILKHYQASPGRHASKGGAPSHPDPHQSVPSSKGSIKDQMLVTKTGRTLIIPPPPAPPGGRSPGALTPREYNSTTKPGTMAPRDRDEKDSANQPKKPPRTYASMYDFPSDPTKKEPSPEVEKMPAVGTKTEFGTAV